MQKNTVKWTPGLPAAQVQAMYMLNMGCLDRITLIFETNWWDNGRSEDYDANTACWIDRLSKDNTNTPFTEFYSLTGILKKPVLIAFNTGNSALKVSEIAALCHKTLLRQINKLTTELSDLCPLPDGGHEQRHHP